MSLASKPYTDWFWNRQEHPEVDRWHRYIDQYLFPTNNSNLQQSIDQCDEGMPMLGYAPSKLFRRIPSIPRRFNPLDNCNNWRNAKKLQPQQQLGCCVPFCIPEGDKYYVTQVDVRQFSPEEINVRVVLEKSLVVVEAKHEEKQDEHGTISRRFVKKFDYSCSNLQQIETQLSSDAVLTISAPKRKALLAAEENTIKIHYTGEPAVIYQQQHQQQHQQPQHQLQQHHDQQQHYDASSRSLFLEQFNADNQQPGRMLPQRGKKINIKGA